MYIDASTLLHQVYDIHRYNIRQELLRVEQPASATASAARKHLRCGKTKGDRFVLIVLDNNRVQIVHHIHHYIRYMTLWARLVLFWLWTMQSQVSCSCWMLSCSGSFK